MTVQNYYVVNVLANQKSSPPPIPLTSYVMLNTFSNWCGLSSTIAIDNAHRQSEFITIIKVAKTM